MKKRTRAIVLLFIICVIGLVTVSCYGNRSEDAEAWNDTVSAVRDENVPEDALESTPTPAMFDYKLVAHALGGIDGYTYLNSKEGFEDSYRRGMRFIETDLYFSEDGELICSHGFKEADVERMGIEGLEVGISPDYDTWNGMRFYNRYTTQDADDILYYMETYPELYFEFDMRSLKGEDAYRMARAVLDKFGNDRELFERILIQVYSEEMYEIFKEVYDFPVMQFYMTKAFCKDIDTYIEFCKTHDITSIAISDSYITEEILEKLLNCGIKIMVHTVDDAEKAAEYLRKGVTVICTNHLYADAEGTIKSK